MVTETKRKPWEMSAELYQMSIGVHQPWIAEISPWQMGQMGKRQKAEYEKKRSAEWQASADAKAEWKQKIIDAYDKEEITKETSGLHPEAKSAIFFIERDRKERAKSERFDKAYVENRIRDISELKVGDRVYDLMTRKYGKVLKLYKKSVKVKWDEPIRVMGRETDTYPVNVRQLQWLSYDDLKEKVGGQETKPAPIPPEPKVEKGKEPWQMTREEYVNLEQKSGLYRSIKASEANHEFYIRRAIGEGKPVPPEVLKDYPDLKKPEVISKLTGDIWNRMTPIEREQLGVKAKLDAETRGGRWMDLFPQEKRALIREYKKGIIKPLPPEPKVEKGKEPWQMTREEYVNLEQKSGLYRSIKASEANHEFYIRRAIGEGKPVPPEVLKDYPDLKKPEVISKLTGDIWNRMTPIEREQLGVKAKLDAETRGGRWMDLFPQEKRALIREYKKGIIKPLTPEPKVEKGKVKAEARYKELMRPRLEAHDKEIKTVNDDFMAGKMTPKEMEEKHKAIHKKTDAVAATMRKKAWGEYPETLPSLAELEKVQRMRSSRSQASDLARRHSVVISSDNPKVAAWLHDQGTADISGIDTPRLTRKTPRITPKRPKLRR